MTIRKILTLSILLSGICTVTYGQGKRTALVKGHVLNNTNKEPFNDLRVTIPKLDVFATTDGNGNFSLAEIPYGVQIIIISGSAVNADTLRVTVDKDIVDLKEIYVAPNDKAPIPVNAEIPTIPIEYTNATQDDDVSTTAQNSGGMFVAADDPFLYVMSNFYNQYQFRPRGTDNTDLQINGISMMDLERGYWSWSQVGGLNDVLHSRNVVYGLKPSSYAFGGTNGSTYLDATAMNQRKGMNASYTATNRNYRNMLMLTYNSGLTRSGWAYSVSLSHRWANEGYIPGTYYDGYSFYAAVSKVIGKGQFNLTALASPTKRGGSTFASTDEAFDFANDHQYNSSWGYQNGKKRDSKNIDASQPIIIANYTYKPSDKTRWNTAIGYEFGKYKSSVIDYYKAYSPYPDYYRNFPSYYLSLTPPATGAAAAIKTQLQNHPEQMQINWDALYNANYINYETIHDVNGIAGNDVTGRRSLYVMSNNVDDQKTMSFSTNIEHNANEHLTLYGGLKFVLQRDEYYKQLTDLMGGDFYVNFNQFAVQNTLGSTNYNQNDLNKPNQLIRPGDKYSYDYIGRIMQTTAWGQALAVYNKADVFAAVELGNTGFSREGLMRNGLFPNNSYGTSPMNSFLTYKIKGGITYKIDLKNSLYLNAAYIVDAPSIANTYISPRTRDFTVNDPTTYNIKTMECGYLLKSPKFNARVTGYVTDVNDFTYIQRYYNDDPALQSFVNYVMQHTNSRSIGFEVSGVLKVYKNVSLTATASVGQSFYTNRPEVNIYDDNDPSTSPVSRQVFLKNYYMGVGPQSIYCLGINYRPRSWRFNVNFNYLDRNYVEVNPDRLTQEATALITPGSQQWKDILSQEKLPAAFTVDLNVSKPININQLYKKLSHTTSAYFSLGISNLLNNQDIKVAGYEQLRYNFADRNVSRFLSKYDYAYGINFYASLSLQF